MLIFIFIIAVVQNLQIVRIMVKVVDTKCYILQVRRALIIMHQREEVEYKRERRVILRKA